MHKNKLHVLMLVSVVAITMLSATTSQQAHAHALNTINGDWMVHHPKPGNPSNMDHIQKVLSLVLGHTAEPAIGFEKGLHDGRHNMEFFLSDKATALKISNANLQVDRYYFKDLKSFNKATSVNQADSKQANLPLTGVFGDPGHYAISEVLSPGIVGYRVHGTLTYFGIDGTSTPIDATVFCSTPAGQTTKFNSAGWFGGYNCPNSYQDYTFPPNHL